MTEIFDTNKLPERRLTARNIIAMHPGINFDEAAMRLQQDIARQLAVKILEGEPIFRRRYENGVLEYTVDCIVMTTDEYAAMRCELFKDGVKHAQGFMPTYQEMVEKQRDAAG